MKRQEEKTVKKYKQSIGARVRHDINMLMVIAISILAVTAVILNFTSNLTNLENDMNVTVQVAAERVSQELEVTKTIVTELGGIPRLSDPNYTAEQKQDFINQRVEYYGMVRGKLISANGICEYDGTDYSDREYFQRSMQGEVVVSEPVISKTDGQISVIISAPVWKDGEPGGEVVGVVFLVPDPNFLNDIMASIKISEGAGAYMLSSSGVTIAHNNPSIAQAQENTIEMSKTDSSLKTVAELNQKMIKGESGDGIYTYGGVTKILAYAPVAGTDGWSLALNAPISDFLGSTVICIIIAVIIALIAIAFGVKTASIIGKLIGDPIKLCADRLVLLSKGDLHSPMPEITSEDETRILADATASLVNNLQVVIKDADYLLGEMSDGNFAINTEHENEYVGDFHGLILSMRKLNRKLDVTLKNVLGAVEQVTIGANQMAESAQGLAEGATNQASAVEELTATVNTVSGMAVQSAEAAENAYNSMLESVGKAQSERLQMQELQAEMARIKEISNEIEAIVTTIEEIASQTSLLSLNASIEAARAGDAGRGFAVVADQIGKLATDSAQAVVNTKELIGKTIEEIDKGDKVTESTAAGFERIIKDLETFAEAAKGNTEVSRAQSQTLTQVEEGIEQISGVVQNNAATAEETSATSEELSAQATNMNEMVSAFKLRKEK